MARLELVEREICVTQNAAERREGVWNVWTNDPYWHRRLRNVGATVVREAETGTDYTVHQRQILLRKVPAPRSGPRRIEFLQRRASRDERTATHIRAETVAAEQAQ